MRYLTDRQRAEGKGAAHTGTAHHWFMSVSAVALVILVPIFLFVFGRTLGAPQEAVIATFSNPFVAIVTALAFIVGMRHFARGAQMMIEDYAGGTTRHVLVLIASGISWVVMASVLYALAKFAFLDIVLGAMG
ncbi:succinate dehydrogenase, hydrophobic membrane anchor protein [Paenirhodobacter sp.]|jgi:succinate dehydrogenase / fumarate reductase membrane anchor subunit|uniref:succinate dehydrogenase, hydrophobic membrane anchor protein n=1 Tax=Paenirhodobacter sp. TaxID=1965326 RepID=UPI003B511238